MVKDTALGWIPTVAKGMRVTFTERQQGRDRRSGTKDGNIISEQEAIQGNGWRRIRGSGRRDTMSGRGRDRPKKSRKGVDVDGIKMRTKNRTLEDTSRRGEGRGRVVGDKDRDRDIIEEMRKER